MTSTAGMTDLENSFAEAYKQKFLELLKQSCSSLSPSDKAEVCAGTSAKSQPFAPLTAASVRPLQAFNQPMSTSVKTKPKNKILYSLTFVVLILAILYVGYLIYKELQNSGNKNFGSSLAQIDHALNAQQKPKAASVGIELPETGVSLPKQGKHIIMIHSQNCGHCHKIRPAFQKLAGTFSNAKLSLCNDKCYNSLPDSDKQIINLEGFPTFCAFDEGKMIARKVGAPSSEEELIKMCQSMF